MKLYVQTYRDLFKRNFMLVLIACTFLIFTFFIWAGFPIFIVGHAVSQFTANVVIIHACISLSGGFLFSLFFVPINLKVAKNSAYLLNNSLMLSFFRLQTTWLLVSAILFEFFFMIVLLF